MHNEILFGIVEHAYSRAIGLVVIESCALFGLLQLVEFRSLSQLSKMAQPECREAEQDGLEADYGADECSTTSAAAECIPLAQKADSICDEPDIGLTRIDIDQSGGIKEPDYDTTLPRSAKNMSNASKCSKPVRQIMRSAGPHNHPYPFQCHKLVRERIPTAVRCQCIPQTLSASHPTSSYPYKHIQTPDSPLLLPQ